jgi:penicillin-binding protein-related factor A (putative recombinase)
VIVEDEAPVDFDAWNHHGAWRFEAKATRAARWSLSQLEPHQARRLTSWHRPSIGRHAGIALAFFRPDEVVSVWLPWDVLAVYWSRWAGGKAKRGEASITVDEAVLMGSCWDEDMFR